MESEWDQSEEQINSLSSHQYRGFLLQQIETVAFLHGNALHGEKHKWGVSIKSLSSPFRNPYGRGGGKAGGARADAGHQETQALRAS